MTQNSTFFSVALNKETKAALEIVAKDMGVSLGKLFKEAIGFYLSFDSDFRDKIEAFAKDLGVLSPFVIQRLALAHWAEMATEEEFAGGPIPKLLVEFVPGLDAMAFFTFWKDKELKALEAKT